MAPEFRSEVWTCRSAGLLAGSSPRYAVRRLALALIALGLAFIGCDDADRLGPVMVTADDSKVPEELRSAYQTDAARLTLRRLTELGSPALDEIELPAEEVDRFYAALIRVYNLRHPARDAVVETYWIHTFPRPSVHYLSLRLASPAWAEAWRWGERLTGNPTVDSLVVSYDLQVEWYYRSHPGDLVTVFSPRAVNIQALAARFARVEGVLRASAEQFIGDGSDIVACDTQLGLELEYSVGYGDCLAGCINRHYWAFRVGQDGRVEFLGSWGDPPPRP